jgi:hypothetical protein
VADGEETPTVRRLRPAAPAFDGPLGSSGAAPEEPYPEPERAPEPEPATAGPGPEPTGAATLETTPEPDPDAKPDPGATPEAEPKSGAESETEPKPEAEPEAEAGATPQSDTKPGANTAPGADADADAKPDPDATADPDPDPDATAEPKPDPDPDATAEPKPESDPDATAEPKSEAGAGATGSAGVPGERRRRRIRVRFAHAARRVPPPRQAVVAGARWVRAWSHRPSGRLVLPGLLLLLLVATTAVAGAVVIPAVAGPARPAAIDASPTSPNPDGVPPGAEFTFGPTQLPTGVAVTTPPVGGVAGGRPAAVLAGWAQQTGLRVGVPALALQAYGYAELVLAQTTPACHLTWTTLAAIGLVESSHGRDGGATLDLNGEAVPHIFGPVLDGKNGTQRIADTDGGTLDGDRVYDRAVGPMQFLPSTWRDSGVDADNDGLKNPHDIDDATLAAGNYLCSNGRDLAHIQDWWNAILSYNELQAYAKSVFDTANRYGTAS